MATRKFSAFTNGGTTQGPTQFIVGYNPALPGNSQNSRWTFDGVFQYPASRNVADESLRWTTAAAPPALSAAAEASLYYNGTNLLVSYNGAAYAALHSGVATVPQGGTGLSSLTAYAVLAGGTTATGNVQQVSGVGTAGQVLTSNGAGALPTWQAAPAGNPAGSGSELQFRNAGVFGAVTNSTVSGASVGFGGAVISSALLGMTSTTQGFRAPQMTTTQRDAIASPSQGLQIVNTTTGELNSYVAGSGGNYWQGLLSDYYTAFNATIANNDANFRPVAYWRIGTDGITTTNPNFSTNAGLALLYTLTQGQNDIDGAGKTTIAVIHSTLNAKGMGQRLMESHTMNAYGNGDAISIDRTLLSSSGNQGSGDEGTKWMRFVLAQDSTLAGGTISSVTPPATISTVTTQAITRNVSAQTVTVADSTGVSAGQWVTVDVGPPTSTAYSRSECVKVASVGPGTITAVFRHNHDSGAFVLPATVLVVSNTARFGIGRYIVNLTAASYSTGQAKGNSIGVTRQIDGSGTGWSNSMVGGDVNNPGVICFEADNVTTSPFSAGSPLRAWYPIAVINSTTSLDIYHRDQVGLAGYCGNASTFGNYTVRPGAQLMAFDPVTSDSATTIVLQHNTETWTPGDTLECAFSPNADVSGGTWDFSWYMPGQTLRDGLAMYSSGPQAWQTGIRLFRYSGSGDAFTTGINVKDSTQALDLTGSSYAAIIRGNGSMLYFINGGVQLGYNGTSYFLAKTGDPLVNWYGATDTLASTTTGSASSTNTNSTMLELDGSSLFLGQRNNATDPRIRLQGVSSNEWFIQTRLASALSNTRLVEFYNYNNGGGGGSGYNAVFWIGNGAYLPSLAAATNGTNQASFKFNYLASVWDGAAAASKLWFTYVAPVSNSTNADQQWAVWRPSTNPSFPTLVLSVDSNGKLTFGATATGGVGTTRAAILDPTGLTAAATRTYTCPDRNGTLALTDVQQKAGDPTTSDIASNTWAVYKNTSTGDIKLWANDGGVMKSSAALT